MKEGIEYFIEDISELRINELLEHLPFEPLIEHFDFTTIGLRTETPVYGLKGVKISADYTYKETCCVKKSFTYGSEGVWIILEWLKYNNDVGIRKTIFKPLNIVEIAKINKSNRDRTITYLQASGIGTPIESYINTLLKRYKNEIDLFIYNNTDDFKNVVEGETEQPYLTYLNIIVEAPSDELPTGKTVKDSILSQIT